jgi:hypothetical protein
VVTAAADATIRYTLDGTDPTESSATYAGPFLISSGSNVTVNARAFRPGETPSEITTRTFTYDADPPSIEAILFPVPRNGWHNSDVTISFACDDGLAIASCSSPFTIDQDGANVQFSGMAIDTAGNQASIGVVINRDTVPPAVVIDVPQPIPPTTDATAVVASAVSDDFSGVDRVTCNGLEATVQNGTATCAVPLKPGRNSIIVTVSDHAGNSSSASIRIRRVAAPPSTIAATPSAMTMLGGQTKRLRVLDDNGDEVLPDWTSSDEAVATATNQNDVTAGAPGTATLTATLDSRTTTVQVTVLAGTALPLGTREWSLAATPSSFATTILRGGIVGGTGAGSALPGRLAAGRLATGAHHRR